MAKTFHENYESVRKELSKTKSPLHLRQLKSMKFQYDFICTMTDDYDDELNELLEERNEFEAIVIDIEEVVEEYKEKLGNQQFEKTEISAREYMGKIIELLGTEVDSNET